MVQLSDSTKNSLPNSMEASAMTARNNGDAEMNRVRGTN